MIEWRRISDTIYEAKLDNGTYRVEAIDGEWTLWFQANFTRGYIRKPGSWRSLSRAKRMATVHTNDHYLHRGA